MSYLARALRQAGYSSDSVVRDLYPIVALDDFDHLLFPRSNSRVAAGLTASPRAILFFLRALFRYDVFHYYFDGGVLKGTLLDSLEIRLLKRLGKKVVLLPYGSDAFVYDRIEDLSWRQALMIDYRDMGREAARVENRIRSGCRHADAVVGCLVHSVNLPRWDVLPLTCYPVDCAAIAPRWPASDGPIRIAHAVNHRGVKGTEFLVAAVEALRARGHRITLTLIERRPNDEALRLMGECDIYFDQVYFGYGLAALEAMALGKVVVSGLENEAHTRVFRRYSYLDECPIVSAGPENLEDRLAELIDRRKEWPMIGRRCRAYVERRHSFTASADLYQAIYRSIWSGEEVDLINLYHPLFEAQASAQPTPSKRSQAP